MNKAILMSVLLMSFPFVAMAIPTWTVVPDQSTMVFTATQNNAPIKGKFTRFDGDIMFDPNQLKESKILLNVDTTSVNTTLQDISDALKTVDWLAATTFPKASFETIDISKVDDKNYTASGNLTIRDKTFPAKADFTVLEFTPEKAQVKGNLIVKRSRYGVGQGEWANTDDIKDDVNVDFNIQLTPKKN